jgi:hypothetical protein
VQRDQVAEHGVVELQRALELREHLHVVERELRDDVVAVLALGNRIRQLPAAPVLERDVARRAEQAVVLLDLLGDLRIFECGVEDVDGLVRARLVHGHERQSSLWSGPGGGAKPCSGRR